ncbi:hypothetical protein [Bradyrhizobium sp. Gha]|uniref:hypothetical protein n=1 Tax=Bradyrhizobium sp. Gha TaxID=1855318 RepID=UPI0008EEB53D|nr:hypothetical protein [Bradyrhizobium sp. Gha]SFI63580.1 hypothetical protein SAMN05216525_111126 [Bradyrhizobium sp. Gha]
MSQYRLKAVLGQGAVWPSRVPRTTSPAAQDALHIDPEFLNQVLLEIGAGSMGHQNAKDLLRRLDPLDLTEGFNTSIRRCCLSSR